MARVTRPDLILMDLSMPVLTGWEAIEELKGDRDLAGIPVLALSAYVLMEGDFARAIESGFVSCITKPAEPKLVLAVVREYFGPAR